MAQALRELANRNNEVKIIGTRRGEKLYESLVSREEGRAAKIREAPIVSRLPRVTSIATSISSMERLKSSRTEDYTSHNAQLLDVGQSKEVLMKVSIVREVIGKVIMAADAVLAASLSDDSSCWETPTAAWPSSRRSGGRFRYFTWKPGIAASTYVFLKRSTVGLLITLPIST